MTAKEALKARAAKRRAGTRPLPGADGAGPERANEQEPAAVELRPEWIAAEPAEAEDAVLAAGQSAAALVQAWQAESNVEALGAVAYGSGNGEGSVLPGSVRKAARRSLQVLKSRGVTIPERPADPVSPGRAGAQAAREAELPVATFVPPDSSGMTFFSVSQRLAGGRYRVADVVIRDETGIMHASSGRLAGKQIRRWRQRVESRLGTAPVDVPLDWARFRIARGRARNETSGQLLPLGLDSCAPLFDPAPTEEPPHPVADLEPGISAEEVTAAAADSEQLHGEVEFRSWLPERPAIDAMLRRVGTRLGADGAENRELVDQVLGEELEAATDRFFTPEKRATLADRMRDAALSVRARADDAAARRVLSVARAVREAGLITSPPRGVPFLVGFFRKALAYMAQQGDGRLQIPLPARPAAGAARAEIAAEPPPPAEEPAGG